ncbi:MAG: hypothetical protein N2593_03420 [Patescibacteria group bacterium]|nr:hypothetical protein [Patescibacteria group bacterium]
MKKIKKIKIIFTIIIFVIFNFIFLQKINAQTEIPLVVMPSRQEIEANPGEKKYITVSFYNQSNEPISGFFKTADFIVEDSNGTPRLIENIEESNPRFSASSWFKLMYNRATLPANNKVSIQAELNIPESARPGGRYSAIFFEFQPKQNQKNNDYQAGLGTSSRIAALIYIKIKGKTIEKAIISRFFAPKFQEYGPIKIETQILNRGDYHITPKGIITLKNYFFNEIKKTNLKEKNIFPDMIRNYENELGQKWMIGKYNINLLASYGSSGQTIDASIDVWVFPWRIFLAIVLTITILIIIISNIYKNLVKKNTDLEKELEKEKEEIEKLKQQLKNNN